MFILLLKYDIIIWQQVASEQIMNPLGNFRDVLFYWAPFSFFHCWDHWWWVAGLFLLSHVFISVMKLDWVLSPVILSVRKAHWLTVLSFLILCGGYTATHISCYASLHSALFCIQESCVMLLSTFDSLLCFCSHIWTTVCHIAVHVSFCDLTKSTVIEHRKYDISKPWLQWFWTGFVLAIVFSVMSLFSPMSACWSLDGFNCCLLFLPLISHPHTVYFSCTLIFCCADYKMCYVHDQESLPCFLTYLFTQVSPFTFPLYFSHVIPCVLSLPDLGLVSHFMCKSFCHVIPNGFYCVTVFWGFCTWAQLCLLCGDSHI